MIARRGILALGAGLGARLGLGAWAGWATGVAGQSAATADPRLAVVHPQLRPMAEQMLAMNLPAPSGATLAQNREGMKRWRQPHRRDVPIERRSTQGLAGAPEVVLHVINAKAGAPRGAILHTHGGGFIAGRAEDALRPLQDLAAELDCVIVSVEYRLAPEVLWAGSVDDNYAGLIWLSAHAAELGADPARIALMGESAGGGHAALLALAARDRGEVQPVFQCLTYPMLDDRTGSTRTMPDHIGKLLWTAEANRFGWTSFLGVAAGGAEVPAKAVPARRTDLKDLPPAFIGVGGIDLFVSEDITYAERLNEAGVPVELVVVPGAFHAFDMVGSDTPVGQAFVARRVAALRSALAPA